MYTTGVAYQLLPEDPLIDNTQCTLDANLMKTLGANSIRVYHVDPLAEHDDCMKTFADAGIYIWLDLDTFNSYIQGPGMSAPQWNETQYEAYQKVMDAFHNYDNLGGFFVGNEVLTSPDTDVAAPYVKAAARDMKAYRDGEWRTSKIASTTRLTIYRKGLSQYPGRLHCGRCRHSSPYAPKLPRLWRRHFGSRRLLRSQCLRMVSRSCSSLFSALASLLTSNRCGEATYDTSGYVFLQMNASDYNIPIFFSETGCIVEPPRTFDDQAAIFGEKMVDTWSGAIIYEWIQETNMYGLVTYDLEGGTATAAGDDAQFGRSGTPKPISPDFENLSKHWATLSPTGIRADDYKPSLTPPPCPDFTSGAWAVSPDAPLPTIGNKAVSDSESSSGSASVTSTATSTASSKAQPEESGDATAAAAESSPTASGSGEASPSSGASSGAGSFAGPLLGLTSCVWTAAALCGMVGFMLVL